MSIKFVTEGGLSIPSGKELELGSIALDDVKDAQSAQSSTALLTENAIVDYVAEQLTAEDLDITVDGGSAFAIDLDSETLEFTSGDGMDITTTGSAITFTVETASATNPGMVELATNDETNTGTDDTRAVTPASLTAWTGDTALVTLGTIATGTWQGTKISGSYIADDTVDSQHYAAGSIDNEHLADDAVDSDELAAGAVDLAHMSDNSVDSDQYVDGSIDGDHIANDALDSQHYAAGSIDNEHLADDAVDSDELAAGSVDLAHMSDNSVDSDQYVDGSIDLAHMSANSVDSDQYVDGSIDLAHMSANSVDSDQYVDLSIDNDHIANATIANGKLVNDSVTVTAGSGLSGGGEVDLGSSVSLALDLSEADAGVIDNSADSFLFVDATDSSTKQESVADLVSGMDGTGLTAASGSLSVDASQTQITALGTIATGEWQGTVINGTYIDNDTIDSQHYAAGSIDNEHVADGAIDNAAVSGSAAIDLDKLDWTSATGTAIEDFAQDDYVMVYDNSESAVVEMTMDSLEDSIFGNVSGDILIAAGGAATIQANSVALATDTTGDYVADVTAGTGLTSTGASSGENISHSLSVDSSQTQIVELGTITTGEWTATQVANAYLANDSVTINSGTGMSGGGEVDLGASLSLSVDATQTQITNIGTSGVATTFAGTVNCDEAVTLDTTLGVTGIATFTAQSVHTGGIDCNGDLVMEGNAITGSATEMVISADGDDTALGGANTLSLNASGGIFTDDAVDMDSTLNVEGIATFQAQSVHSAGLESGGNIVSDTDSTDDLGSSSKRWKNVYTDNRHLEYSKKSSFSVSSLDGTSADTLFTFTESDYNTVKICARVSDGTDYTAREVLLVSNGTNINFVEYGTVSTDADRTMTFSASSAGGVTTVKCLGTASDSMKGSFELLS